MVDSPDNTRAISFSTPLTSNRTYNKSLEYFRVVLVILAFFANLTDYLSIILITGFSFQFQRHQFMKTSQKRSLKPARTLSSAAILKLRNGHNSTKYVVDVVKDDAIIYRVVQF